MMDHPRLKLRRKHYNRLTKSEDTEDECKNDVMHCYPAVPNISDVIGIERDYTCPRSERDSDRCPKKNEEDGRRHHYGSPKTKSSLGKEEELKVSQVPPGRTRRIPRAVIFLTRLTTGITLLVMLSVLLPLCVDATPFPSAIANPEPIRISHSYAKTNDNSHYQKHANKVQPKPSAMAQKGFSVGIGSQSNIKRKYNIKFNYFNETQSNEDVEQQAESKSTISRPFYTKPVPKERERPSYLFNPTSSTTTSSTTPTPPTLSPVVNSEPWTPSTTTTSKPSTSTISALRLHLSPIFNFLHNIQSLTNSYSATTTPRIPTSTTTMAPPDNKSPSSSLESETESFEYYPGKRPKKNKKNSSKGSKKRNNGSNKNKTTFFAADAIVTHQPLEPSTTKSVLLPTSKPTLHPLSVLQTNMIVSNNRANDDVPVALPLVANNPMLNITKPTSGPFPNSGRSNSDVGETPIITFDSYQASKKSKKGSNKGKKGTKGSSSGPVHAALKSDMDTSSHTVGSSVSFGGGGNDRGPTKQLRANFFENFHDTIEDNIAEESRDTPHMTVIAPPSGFDTGPSAQSNTGNGQSSSNVNIPAGYTFPGEVIPVSSYTSNGMEYHFSETDHSAPPRGQGNSYPKVMSHPQKRPPGVGTSGSKPNNIVASSSPPGKRRPNPTPPSGPSSAAMTQSRPDSKYAPVPAAAAPHAQVVPIPMSGPAPKIRPHNGYFEDNYHKFASPPEMMYDYDYNGGNFYGTRPQPPPPKAIPFIHHSSHYYGNTLPKGYKLHSAHHNSNGFNGPLNDFSRPSASSSATEASAPSGPSGSSGPSAPYLTGSSELTGSSGNKYELDPDNTVSNTIIHSNKKVSIMDSFDVFYKEYKLLTWAAVLVATSLALLCLLVFMYVNNPPTEVVTARSHLTDILANPQLLKFMSSVIHYMDGSSTRNKSNSSSRSNKRRGKSRSKPGWTTTTQNVETTKKDL